MGGKLVGLEAADDVPELVVVAEVREVLVDAGGVHVVVVDLEQVVLHEALPLAVYDYAGAHVATHFPDLFHLLSVLPVRLFPETRTHEVETPFYATAVTVLLIEQLNVRLLHFLHRPERLQALVR